MYAVKRDRRFCILAMSRGAGRKIRVDYGFRDVILVLYVHQYSTKAPLVPVRMMEALAEVAGEGPNG